MSIAQSNLTILNCLFENNTIEDFLIEYGSSLSQFQQFLILKNTSFINNFLSSSENIMISSNFINVIFDGVAFIENMYQFALILFESFDAGTIFFKNSMIFINNGNIIIFFRFPSKIIISFISDIRDRNFHG